MITVGGKKIQLNPPVLGSIIKFDNHSEVNVFTSRGFTGLPDFSTVDQLKVLMGTDNVMDVTAPTRGTRASIQVVNDRILEQEDEKNRNNNQGKRILRVGVICGGPSAERGISLNSARSLIDHIQGDDDLHVSCYYIDSNLNSFAISTAQVYSNTPTDLDFKLESGLSVLST